MTESEDLLRRNYWHRVSDEVKATECKVTGTIPSWLNGELMRNGPGELRVKEDVFKHFFDGHALIHKYMIADGKVTYMSKFIKSEDYKLNHERGQIVIGSFGSRSIPDPCKSVLSRFFTKYFSSPPMTQNTNVSLVNLGDKYYALTDAPSVNKINKETLDLEKYITLEKTLGMFTTTGHPHFVADRNGDYFNLGVHAGRSGYYGLYKVPASSMDQEDPMEDLKLYAKIPYDNPLKPSYYHSFALSENYVTLHDHNVRINALKGLKSSFTWDSPASVFEHDQNRESNFLVLDKNSCEVLPTRYCSKGRFTFHHINSYEKTVDGKKFVIVDLCCADGPTFSYFWLKILEDKSLPDNAKEPHMWPYRFVLPLDVDAETLENQNLVEIPGCQATAVKRNDGSVFLTPELLVEEGFSEKYGLWGMELPTINYNEYNTRPYKYMYIVGEKSNGVYNCLFKINVQSKESIQWKAEEGYYPSEPVFVKNPGSSDEDDGVILSSVVNLNPQDPIFLLVLDAKTFTELGRAEIMASLTQSFHGLFTPSP